MDRDFYEILREKNNYFAIMIDDALHNIQFDETAFMLTSCTMSTSK